MRRPKIVITAGVVAVAVVALATAWILMRLLFDDAVIDLEHGKSRALWILRPLAAVGDPAAQYVMGEAYAYGVGVEKDSDRALYWFRRARLTRCGTLDVGAVAAYQVGKRYLDRDTDAARAEGQEWLDRAKRLGFDGSIRCFASQ
jgi:TPR repeat protein